MIPDTTMRLAGGLGAGTQGKASSLDELPESEQPELRPTKATGVYENEMRRKYMRDGPWRPSCTWGEHSEGQARTLSTNKFLEQQEQQLFPGAPQGGAEATWAVDGQALVRSYWAPQKRDGAILVHRRSLGTNPAAPGNHKQAGRCTLRRKTPEDHRCPATWEMRAASWATLTATAAPEQSTGNQILPGTLKLFLKH